MYLFPHLAAGDPTEAFSDFMELWLLPRNHPVSEMSL